MDLPYSFSVEQGHNLNYLGVPTEGQIHFVKKGPFTLEYGMEGKPPKFVVTGNKVILRFVGDEANCILWTVTEGRKKVRRVCKARGLEEQVATHLSEDGELFFLKTAVGPDPDQISESTERLVGTVLLEILD